jgi:hypothetical protein
MLCRIRTNKRENRKNLGIIKALISSIKAKNREGFCASNLKGLCKNSPFLARKKSVKERLKENRTRRIQRGKNDLWISVLPSTSKMNKKKKNFACEPSKEEEKRKFPGNRFLV